VYIGIIYEANYNMGKPDNLKDRLNEIAKKKLEDRGMDINPYFSIIPRLMQLVFNDDTPTMGFRPSDENGLMMEIYDQMFMTDQEVIEYLVSEEEDPETIVRQFEEAKTDDDLRDFLIAELLWNAKSYHEDWNPDLELTDAVNTDALTVAGKGYHGKLSTLLAWNKADPVDSFEFRRNNIIYSYQKNRNPFIDHPEFAYLIWTTTGVNMTEVSSLKFTQILQPIISLLNGPKMNLHWVKCIH
jgi:hypothetical protein